MYAGRAASAVAPLTLSPILFPCQQVRRRCLGRALPPPQARGYGPRRPRRPTARRGSRSGARNPASAGVRRRCRRPTDQAAADGRRAGPRFRRRPDRQEGPGPQSGSRRTPTTSSMPGAGSQVHRRWQRPPRRFPRGARTGLERQTPAGVPLPAIRRAARRAAPAGPPRAPACASAGGRGTVPRRLCHDGQGRLTQSARVPAADRAN
jgi:hypothetical protein